MMHRLILAAGLALAGCAADAPVVPAGGQPATAAEHAERDLDQLVDATIQGNAMLAMIARQDAGLREDLRGWTRAASQRGGMIAARAEARERSSKAFNRYARKYIAVTTDESAVTFGRAMHAFMSRVNASSSANCGLTDIADLSRRRPDLEVPFSNMLRAFEQAIVSAKVTPQPAPSADLLASEFLLIQRRVAGELGVTPAMLTADFGKLTQAEDRIRLCRAAEYFLREVLAYRSESAGPMVRAMYAALTE